MDIFLTEAWCRWYMPSIVAPGQDLTLTFHNRRNILFFSIPDTMESPAMSVVFLLHLWWLSFFKLIFLVLLSDCNSCYLVALNTVWYCWRISSSWQPKMGFLISSCSFCFTSSDKLAFVALIFDVVANSIAILKILNILFCGSVSGCCF